MLVLGDVIVQAPPPSGALAPFAAFFLAHPCLRALALSSRCGMLPSELGALRAHPDSLSGSARSQARLRSRPRSQAPSARRFVGSGSRSRSGCGTRRRSRSPRSCARTRGSVRSARLSCLRLLTTTVLPSEIGALGAHLTAHPALRAFASPPAFAAALPGAVGLRLRALALALVEPLRLRDASPLALATLLRALLRLRALSAPLVLTAGCDHGGALRALFGAGPGRASKRSSPCARRTRACSSCVAGCRSDARALTAVQDAAARAFRTLRRLRALHLALVPVPGDEPPLSAATKIARVLPRLHRATLTRLAPGRRGQFPRRLAPPPEWLVCAMDADDYDSPGVRTVAATAAATTTVTTMTTQRRCSARRTTR
jgi:hypothetical protein